MSSDESSQLPDGSGSSATSGRSRDADPDAPLKTLASVNSAFAVLLFGALTVVVSLQVLTRFVLHLPLIWSEEVARFLFFWVALMGSAMSVRRRRHFVLDISMGRDRVTNRVLRFLFDVLPDLCVLGFSTFLLIQGIGYARAGLFRTATNSQINMGIVYAAIPVFAALSIAYAAVQLYIDFKVFVAGRGAEHHAPAGGE